MQVRIDWQWSAAVVYCVTLIVLAWLVSKQIVHPEILLGMFLWLAPSPWAPRVIPSVNPSSASKFDA